MIAEQFFVQINDYVCHFQLIDPNTMSITNKSSVKQIILFATITTSSLSNDLKNIVENAFDLYELLQDKKDSLKINKENRIVFQVEQGKIKKNYWIPLENAILSHQDIINMKIKKMEKELEFYKDLYGLIKDREELQDLIQELTLKHNFQDKRARSKMVNASSIESFSKCTINHKFKPLQLAGRRCQTCTYTFKLEDIAYSCKKCGFNSCNKCLQIKNKNLCPNDHPLVYGVRTTYLTSTCNICSKIFGWNKGYTCKDCDYDVCKKCI